MRRKILKYCLFIVGGVIAALLTLFVLLQTSWVRDMALDLILDAVNSSIKGEIHAGEIGGNLFSTIELNDISLRWEGRSVVTIGSVKVEFDSGDLLRQRITVSRLHVESVSVHLSMEQDSVWNIERAVEARTDDEPAKTGSKRFDWSINVDSLFVSSLSGTVIREDTLAAVRDLSLLASVEYTADLLAAQCQRMSLGSSTPPVNVVTSSFTLRLDTTALLLSDIVIESEENSVSGQAGLDLHRRAITFDLSTGPVHPEEFRGLIGDFPDIGNPTVHLTGSVIEDTVAVHADIREDVRQLAVDLRLSTGADTLYAIHGVVRQFEVSSLVGDSLLVSPLNGEFSLVGKGMTPGEMTCKAQFAFREFTVSAFDLGTVSGMVTLDRKVGRVDVRSDGPMGIAEVSGQFSDPQGSGLFSLEGTVRRGNLMQMTGFQTNGSVHFALNGTLPVSPAGTYSLWVDADSVVLDTVQIDRFVCAVQYRDGTLHADSIVVSRAGTRVVADGSVDTTGQFDIRFSARAEEISQFLGLSGFDSLAGSAAVKGDVRGTTEAFSTRLAATVTNAGVDGKHLGNLSLRVGMDVSIDSMTSVRAESLAFSWNESHWSIRDTLSLAFGTHRITLKPVTIVSDGGEMSIEGDFVANGDNRFSLVARRFEVGGMAHSFLGIDATGVIDLEVRGEGTRENLHGMMSFVFEEGVRNEVKLPTVHLRADLADSVLRWNLGVTASGGELSGEGILPVDLSDTTDVLVRDRPISITLTTEQFDLSLVQPLNSGPVTVTGRLNGEITVGGTLNNPIVEGGIRIDSGAVGYPALGVDYSGIRIRLTGSNDSLLLEEFTAEQGAVTGSGSVTLGYEDSLRIEPKLEFRVTNFEVLTGPQHFATINGDVKIDEDDQGSILLNSDITLNRSRFYLPALQGLGGVKDPDPPLLMVAAGRIDTTSGAVADSAKRRFHLPPFKGKATIRIPRGTWIRGPRLNVELSGTLEIAPAGQAMTIVGFLVVEQGTYEWYGRKFVFKQGRIDFDQGAVIDPSIYFEIEYTFRTEEIENQMLIIVRGRSQKPTIEFFFNRDPITESDAISYVIFGRKVDDLNYGQKSTVADLGDALALDLAASMINAQLSSMVGDQLGLDVVRVSGEDNWNKAVLTAGKYVTDDLYVAYERGISQSGASSVVFESARMEYYLMKFLYLHLIEATDKTSGVDVFLKFD